MCRTGRKFELFIPELAVFRNLHSFYADLDPAKDPSSEPYSSRITCVPVLPVPLEVHFLA
jgi:hypothetical protein